MQLLRRRQQPPHEESVAGGVWVEAVPRTPSAEDLAARAVAHSVNFRDLGTVCPCIQLRRAYRSSQLVSTTELRGLNIRTVLDLRQPPALCTVHHRNVRRQLRGLASAIAGWCSRALRRREAAPSETGEAACGPEPCARCSEACCDRYGVPAHVYHVDLLPRQATLSIFGQLPFRLQAKVAWTALRRQQPEPIVAGAIADPDVIGYLKLYKILLERSKLRLRCAFRLFADPGNLPALIHCIHGKDRTGLVAMMLLMLCGADRQTVVRDYAQSEALLRESRERRELLGLDHYLTTDQVIAAAARVMEATLDHVDARYGGVAGYLSHIGLSRAEVAAIRENLAGSHEALVARQGEEDGENKQCALR